MKTHVSALSFPGSRSHSLTLSLPPTFSRSLSLSLLPSLSLALSLPLSLSLSLTRTTILCRDIIKSVRLVRGESHSTALVHITSLSFLKNAIHIITDVSVVSYFSHILIHLIFFFLFFYTLAITSL